MADVTIEGSAFTTLNRIVWGRQSFWVTNLIGYQLYIDSVADGYYRKTTDGGQTWGSGVLIITGSILWLNGWWDQDTLGITGTKIHITYADTTADDAVYISLDTSTDTLSSPIIVGNNVVTNSTQNPLNSHGSITKARGGNLYYHVHGSAAGTDNLYRSVDDGANWTSRTAIGETGGGDVVELFPGNYADNQDIDAIYGDVSASELTLKTYDDSANTVSESSVITTVAFTGGLSGPSGNQWAGSIDHANGDLVILIWNDGPDAAAADLKCFRVNGAASITTMTDLVTNKDDMGYTSVFIDQNNGDLYVCMIGKDDGTETFGTSVNAYYMKSTDGGTTWAAQVKINQGTAAPFTAITCAMGGTNSRFYPVWFDTTADDLLGNYVNSVVINVTFSATGSPALSQLVGSAAGVHTQTSTGTLVLPQLAASGVGLQVPTSTGTPTLPQLVALGDALQITPVTGTGAPLLPQLVALGAAQMGDPVSGTGAPTLLQLIAAGVGSYPYLGSGAPTLLKLVALGASNFILETRYFESEEFSIEWVLPLAQSVHNLVSTTEAFAIEWVLPKAYQYNRRNITLITSQPYGVFIHHPFWPYQRVLDVSHTAFNVNRSYSRMDAGHGTLDMPKEFAADIYQGQLLVIVSSDQPDWVGPLYTREDTFDTTRFTAMDYASILGKRVIPQEEHYDTPIGASQVVRSYINRMNGRSPTGIILDRDIEAGPLIQDLASGGQTVFDGLNEIYDRTDWEWWFEHTVTAGRIRTILHFGRRQGVDRRRSTHLWYGINLKDAILRSDLSEGKSVSTVMGGFGVPVWTRNSVGQAGAPAINRAIAINTVLAPELIVRTLAELPAGLRDERIEIDVTTDNTAELTRRSAKENLRRLTRETTISFTINNMDDRSDIAVGNVISIHAPVGRSRIDGPVRLVQVQPDEELQETDCEAEVRLG